MTEGLYDVAQVGQKDSTVLCYGLPHAYEIFRSYTAAKQLPDLETFTSKHNEEWFVEAFKVRVTKSSSKDILEKLEKTQDEYSTHYTKAQQLKASRTELIKAALQSGEDVGKIAELSGQSIFDIERLSGECAHITDKTTSEIEMLVFQQRSNLNKTRVKKGQDIRTDQEREWLHDWKQLKEWRVELRKSKKEHGDGWGCDFSQEEFDALEDKVENTVLH